MIIAEEQYGSSTENLQFILTVENRIVIQRENVREWNSMWSTIKSIFLPKGYPESVSRDYLQYQLWDSIQAFCSSITSGLSTQAILKGAGVGDASATAVAATMTWIIKDGCGHVGRILFAWLKATELDCNSKRWRLFADILNDLAIFFELVSPLFPSCFTAIVCASSVMKAIVGVSGGATRAALTQHQARRKNLADVSAKDGSQETLVNLSALICSLILLPVLSGKTVLTWTLFFMFTALHIAANYFAVTAVQMETLNFERYKILVNNFLRSDEVVLSVAAANRQESVWLNIWPKSTFIKLGSTFSKAVESLHEFDVLQSIFGSSDYLLNIKTKSKKHEIPIVLHQGSTPSTQLRAVFQALVISNVMDSKKDVWNLKVDYIKELLEARDNRDTAKLLVSSKNLTNKLIDSFVNGLQENGWETSFNLLGADEWRSKWKDMERHGKTKIQ